MTYEVGTMAHSVNSIAFLDIRLALVSDLFHNAGKIASYDTANTPGTGSVMQIGRVDSDRDCLDFDIVSWQGLLFDVRETGDAVFFDDDGLHSVNCARVC
jgi:hypothetical protein